MNTNPINLAIRFLLELTTLVILGCWGWHVANGLTRYALAAGLPIVAAILWRIFRIQNDPKPAPVEVPGIVRLLLECLLFGAAVFALYSLRFFTLSIIMVVILTMHYIISYDRTWAMVRNKPYDGFLKK